MSQSEKDRSRGEAAFLKMLENTDGNDAFAGPRNPPPPKKEKPHASTKCDVCHKIPLHCKCEHNKLNK
jgi:hypothetical protein